MKILYITAIGEKTLNNLLGEETTYDMKIISTTIKTGIEESIEGSDITMISDIHEESKDNGFSSGLYNEFDIFLCDLTTLNANVTYVAGQVEMTGKPVLYIKSNNSVHPATFSHKNILSYSEASIKNEFLHALTDILNLAISNPAELTKESIKSKPEPKAFLSYSHQDIQYLERLKVHLKPLIKKGLIDIWDDSKINTGDKWQDEIEKALAESSIAILLVSADFLASDFIIDNELPPLLSTAEVKGTTILPVILSFCRFSREPTLSRFQAVNSPDEPLSSLDENAREKIYDQLARDIERAITTT